MKVTDETVLVFETYTGSTYEINHGKIRRLNPDYEKRGDGNWYTLYNWPEIEVGHPAYLVMESLSHLGPDDYGLSTIDRDAVLTTRTTSEVVGIDVLNEGGVAW